MIKFYKGQTDNYDKTLYGDGIYFCKDTKKIIIDDQCYGTPDTSILEITHALLLDLKNNSKLIPNKQYRIIDFVTIVNYMNDSITSAGNPFDIIITASSNDSFYEDVKADHHEGDEYFINSNLKKWKLKYDIDNNIYRYSWVNKNLGNDKGVIYYMKDEFNNEAPYDFKNVLYLGVYTFDLIGIDASLEGNAYNNKISPYFASKSYLYLNYITFTCDRNDNEEITVTRSTHDNIFENDCYNIVIKDNCSYNHFKDYCHNITLYDNCSYNYFGSSNINNELLANSSFNKLGDHCSDNIIIGSFNTLISRNIGNTIHGENNILNNNCSKNILSSIFGSVLEDNCSYNLLEEGIYYNLHLLYNTLGTADFPNIITIPQTSNTYKTYIAKDSEGNIIITNNKTSNYEGFTFAGFINNEQLKTINKTPDSKIYYTLSGYTSFDSLLEFENLRVAGSNYEYSNLSEENTTAYTQDYTFYHEQAKYNLVYNKNIWVLCPYNKSILPPEGLLFVNEKNNTASGIRAIYILSPTIEYIPNDTLISSLDSIVDSGDDSGLGDCHYGKTSLGLGHKSYNSHYPDVKSGLNIVANTADKSAEITSLYSNYARSADLKGSRIKLEYDGSYNQSIVTFQTLNTMSGIDYVEPALLKGLAEPQEANDAVNKLYVDDLISTTGVVLTPSSDNNDSDIVEYILEPNQRLRIRSKYISKDTTFILNNPSRLIAGIWNHIGDESIEKFEVEFMISVDVETIPTITFVTQSKLYDVIHWEKPLELKKGSYYRITIDNDIATYIEIQDYQNLSLSR